MSTETSSSSKTSVLYQQYNTSQQFGKRSKRLTTKKIRLVSLGVLNDRTIDLTITAKLPVVEVGK